MGEGLQSLRTANCLYLTVGPIEKCKLSSIKNKLTHYRPAMAFGNRKIYFTGFFQFSIHRSGNLKFNYLGIFESLKLRILMETILPISLKLNFTPNTSGCYGLSACIESATLRYVVSPFHILTCPKQVFFSGERF